MNSSVDAFDPVALSQLRRTHPYWRIDYLMDARGYVACRLGAIAEDYRSMGLLEVVRASNVQELHWRLNLQEAIAAGVDALLLGVDITA